MGEEGVTKEYLIARTQEVLVAFGSRLSKEDLNNEDFVVRVGLRADFLGSRVSLSERLGMSPEMNFPENKPYILSVKMADRNVESSKGQAVRAALAQFFTRGNNLLEKMTSPTGIAATSLEELGQLLEEYNRRAMRKLEKRGERMK